MKRMKKVLLLCIIASLPTLPELKFLLLQGKTQFSKLSAKLPTPLSELEKAFLAPKDPNYN